MVRPITDELGFLMQSIASSREAVRSDYLKKILKAMFHRQFRVREGLSL